MLTKNLEINKCYRHKDHPSYCYARVLKILKPKEGENTTNKIIVKCAYTVSRNDHIGLIKYFSPKNLVEMEEKYETMESNSK